MRKKTRPKTFEKTFVELADELRVKLREIDQKLEHLIQSYRRWSNHHSDSSFDDINS